MGENKNDNDQEAGKTATDGQQIYGSYQKGRHNLEASSSSQDFEDDDMIASIRQQDSNQQHIDNQEKISSGLYETDDIDLNTSTGQSNEYEKTKMVSIVEGDDEDILGETENAYRNEQKIKAKETIQGNPHNLSK